MDSPAVNYEVEAPQSAPKFEVEPPAKEQPGFLDREIPLDSYKNATLNGVQSVGRAFRGIGQGVAKFARHPIDTADEMVNSVADLPSQAAQVPAAIHDINQSPDPLGTYAKVAQETAAQGGAQAATAVATEKLGEAAPEIARGVKTAAKPVLRGVGKAARVVGDSVDPDLVGLASPRAGNAIRYAAKMGRTLDPQPAAPRSVAPPPIKFSTRVVEPEPIPQATPPPVKFSTRPAAPESAPEVAPPPVRYSTRIAKPDAVPQSAPPPVKFSTRIARPGATPEPAPIPIASAPADTPSTEVPPVARPSGDPWLDRLRARAEAIKQEGHGAEVAEPEETARPGGPPLRVNGKPVPPDTDLTAAGKASLRKVRAAKRIARPN